MGVVLREERDSGPGGIGTTVGVAIDAEFFQGSREVGAVMLPKHVHLNLGLSPLTSVKRAFVSERVGTREERSRKRSTYASTSQRATSLPLARI